MVLTWYSVWYSIFGRPRKNINTISFVTSYIETRVSIKIWLFVNSWGGILLDAAPLLRLMGF